MNRVPKLWRGLLLACFALLPLASGCRSTALDTQFHPDEMPELAAVEIDGKLNVVATTTIVADVVGNVGGDRIALKRLIPLGVDPHAFEPTPQDAASVADAHVVFVNGAGLEAFLEKLIESAGEGMTVVPVSYGVDVIDLKADTDHEGGDQGHGSTDPHTWFDPENVKVWVKNIERALSALDPANADTYAANSAVYITRLVELDTWIRARLSPIPKAKRKLVTDHASFGYFARRYGFEQVGAVLPGYSTLSEPSAKERAALEDNIVALGVKAVFVGMTANPDLAERIAADTGTALVYLYTGSLSAADGPAEDYISLMQYNVQAIAEALE